MLRQLLPGVVESESARSRAEVLIVMLDNRNGWRGGSLSSLEREDLAFFKDSRVQVLKEAIVLHTEGGTTCSQTSAVVARETACSLHAEE
jgi:hypothetical protein